MELTPSLETPLCQLLGIRHPILSVGFGDSAVPELVSAVSNAGGAGVLGASGAPPEEIRRRIARTREVTGRPFGVNFIIDERGDVSDEDKAYLRTEIATAATERPAFLVLFWGDPAPFVETAHRHGVRVLTQVGSVDEARRDVEAGVDAVIAQGFEAGGHVIGTTSLWELLPDVVAAVAPVPVLASGGIGTGAQIARALRAGAQGVSLGTRFVASREGWFHDYVKQRVVQGRAEDTVYNELYDVGWPNAPHRTLRNRTYDEWVAAGRPRPGSRPGEGSIIGVHTTPSGRVRDFRRYSVGMIGPTFEGDIEYVPVFVGLSVSDVTDIKPAAEIVADLVREAEAALGGPPPGGST